MVDLDLANEVRELTEKGTMKEDPKNILKLMELLKQVSAEDEELKEANWETMGGMMSGEVDDTAAYMSGDLVIEGNLQDTMAYGEFMRIAVEAMQRLGQE